MAVRRIAHSEHRTSVGRAATRTARVQHCNHYEVEAARTGPSVALLSSRTATVNRTLCPSAGG